MTYIILHVISAMTYIILYIISAMTYIIVCEAFDYIWILKNRLHQEMCVCI